MSGQWSLMRSGGAAGGPPRRRIPDGDVVIVGRARAPEEELKDFRRRAIGISLILILALVIGLETVRANNLTGWRPLTIDEVVVQRA